MTWFSHGKYLLARKGGVDFLSCLSSAHLWSYTYLNRLMNIEGSVSGVGGNTPLHEQKEVLVYKCNVCASFPHFFENSKELEDI